MATTTMGTTAQTQSTAGPTTTAASAKSRFSRFQEAYKASKAAGPTTKKRSTFASVADSVVSSVQRARGLHGTVESGATTGDADKTKTTNTTANTTSSAPPPPPKPTGPTQSSPTQTGNSTTAPGSKQPLKKTPTADETTLTSLVRSWVPSRQKAMYILGGVAVGATMLGGLGWYLDQSSPTASTAASSGMGTARVSDLSRDVGGLGTGSTLVLPAQELRLDTTAKTFEASQPILSSAINRSVTSRSQRPTRGPGGRPRRPRGRKAAEPDLLGTAWGLGKSGASYVGKGLGHIGGVVKMFGAGRELELPGSHKGKV